MQGRAPHVTHRQAGGTSAVPVSIVKPVSFKHNAKHDAGAGVPFERRSGVGTTTAASNGSLPIGQAHLAIWCAVCRGFALAATSGRADARKLGLTAFMAASEESPFTCNFTTTTPNERNTVSPAKRACQADSLELKSEPGRVGAA